MTNTKQKTATLDVADFKNDITRYASMGANYVGVQYFDWDDLEIQSRQYQTRASDADLGHIAMLAADIESVGLQTLPVVELDPIRNKYSVLSGFHRLLAMRKNNDQPDHQKSKYPAIILEFQSSFDRWNFLQDENNHRPAKPHGKNDAIHYLKTMKSHGYFDTYGKDTKAIQTAAYDLLSKNYPRIKTSAKLSIFKEALDTQIKKVRTFTKQEAYNDASKYYGKQVKSGQVDGDTCYVVSDYNVAVKVVKNAMLSRANQIVDKNASNGLSVKVLTWVPKGNESLSGYRKKAVKDVTTMNTTLYNPKVGVVAEIVFLPQALHPVQESDLIKYTWDPKKKMFIQSK